MRRPPYGPATEIAEHHQVPVLDIGAIAMIRAGKIAVRPGIERFTSDGAVFADGRVEAFDAVVLGTGYRAKLDELLAGVRGLLDDEGTPLLSGGATAQPGLYFCGFRVAAGGQFAQISRESAALGRLIAGG